MTYLPSAPTTNLISAIRSLLNIAALRSRTDPLLACQFGSAVSSVPLTRLEIDEVPPPPLVDWDLCGNGGGGAPCNWKWPKLRAFGEARGDDEGEQG